MKKKMGLMELAQYTYRGLKKAGVEVTLSGGACVSIYTENAYQSGDLDFIRQLGDRFESVEEIMIGLGFKRHGRHFIHPLSEFYVEFPSPPLTVGNESPREIVENKFKTDLGILSVRMLSPTDCVKDRLCGYFYWNDLQSLDQAVMVSAAKKVNMPELKRWAAREGMLERFSHYTKNLAAVKSGKRSRPVRNKKDKP